MDAHIDENLSRIRLNADTYQRIEAERAKRREHTRRKRKLHSELLLKTIESYQSTNETTTVKFVNPTRAHARRIVRFYDEIRRMAKGYGEIEDPYQLWLAHVDMESIHPLVTVMSKAAELTLVQIRMDEKTIPMALLNVTKIRVHVAAGLLKVKSTDMFGSITTSVAKNQTVEIEIQDLKTQKYEFTLTGVQAVVLIEKLRRKLRPVIHGLPIKTEKETEQAHSYYQSQTPSRKSMMSMRSLFRSTTSMGNSQIRILQVKRIEVPAEYQMAPIRSKVPVSYIRNQMDLSEIQERILFLDCEFVAGHKELQGSKMKGTQLLASVAIMDYYGRVILDTRVTPSKTIRDYCFRITGFRPRDLINQRKEEELVPEIHQLVKGRILIGHDLTSDLKVLRIDVDELAGIRDLSTAPTLFKLIPTSNPRLSLKIVSEQILNKPLRTFKVVNGKEVPDPHSALEDVQTIRAVYLKVEPIWEDSSYLSMPKEIECMEWF